MTEVISRESELQNISKQESMEIEQEIGSKTFQIGVKWDMSLLTQEQDKKTVNIFFFHFLIITSFFILILEGEFFFSRKCSFYISYMTARRIICVLLAGVKPQGLEDAGLTQL